METQKPNDQTSKAQSAEEQKRIADVEAQRLEEHDREQEQADDETAKRLEEQKRNSVEIRSAEEQFRADVDTRAERGESETSDVVVREATPAENELAGLMKQREGTQFKEPERKDGEVNPDFDEFRDCDRILAAGTVVKISDIEFRILRATPGMAAAFRDEAVFAEELAETGNRDSFAANVKYLRDRYNANGAKVGVNEAHPLNKLDARITELELQVAAEAKAAAEADRLAREEAAKPLPAAPILSERADVRASDFVESEAKARRDEADAKARAEATVAPQTLDVRASEPSDRPVTG